MSRLRGFVALVCGALLVGVPAARAAADDVDGAPAPALPPTTTVDLAPQAAQRLAQIQPLVDDLDRRAAAATQQRDQLTSELATIDKRLSAGDVRMKQLAADATAAQARADRTKERLGQLSAALYASSGKLGGDTHVGSDADRALAAQRSAQLSESVGIAQRNLLDEFLADKARAEKAQATLRQEKAALEKRKAALMQVAPEALQGAADAIAVADRAHRLVDAWKSVQLGPFTPIMGQAKLSPDELTAWFVGTGRKANATVPIEELSKIFLEEGAAEGVRGDIAFAQSILETGSFGFPSYGQVQGGDNNFAGIGACDSCPDGYGYPDARTGVRAQIQLLRNYADPTATSMTLHNPSLWAKFDSFGLHGKAITWQDLTGRWATSTTYGPKIFDVYFQILNYVTDRLLLPEVTGRADVSGPGGKAAR